MESSRILFCNTRLAFFFFSIQLIPISLFRDTNSHKQSFEFILAFFLVYNGFISLWNFEMMIHKITSAPTVRFLYYVVFQKYFGRICLEKFLSHLNRYKPVARCSKFIQKIALGVLWFWPSIYSFDVETIAVKNEW